MIVEPDITYDPNIVTEGNIRAYTPSLPTLFKESALYAFRTTWWQESLDELEFNLANEGNTLTKEEYDSMVKSLSYLSFRQVKGNEAEVEKFCNNDTCEIDLEAIKETQETETV